MHVSQILAAVDYGWYISIWKVVVVLLLVLLWGRLLTWVDKDAVAAHLPRVSLNTAFLCGLILAFSLFLLLPGFLIALSIFLVVMIAEAATYLILRQQKVGLQDLSKQFSNWVKSFGSGQKEVKAAAGEVLLYTTSGSAVAPPTADSPDLAAYAAVQSLLTEPLRRGAERIEMRASEGAASVRYTVDGVALEGRSIARDDAAAAIVLLKQLAGLDVNDRRKPQLGKTKVNLDGKKQEIEILTAGSTAGESAAIEVAPKTRYERTIDQLGFRDDQLKVVDDTIAEGQGIVLLAAPRGHGLTSLIYAVLRRHDAFLSHIQTIERDPKVDLEGITQNKISSSATPADESKQVIWVASQEPDVLMVDKIDDPRSALELIKYASTGRRAYVGIRAGSTFEALQLWRNLVGDDNKAMAHLKLIVAGRLARKLCAACKMDYNPDPETLRRLNISPERVGKLYTARTTPLRDHKGNEMICEFCLDLRFKGRTGIYEIFIIDDEVRLVVQNGGSINQLKMLFKKQRQKYLQEVALAVAVAGDTSLQEVARVLKAGSESTSSSSPPPAPAGARRG